MNRFGDVLSDVAARLEVPEPAHSRILLELAADMEDLHLAYVQKGLTAEEARIQVVEHFELSDEVLRDLSRVHDTPLKRSLDNLSGQVRTTWARGLLGLVALSVLIPSGVLLSRPGIYGDAGPLAWVLLPPFLAGLCLGGWKGYRLLVTQGRDVRSAQRGLGSLLGLPGLLLGLAFGGIWLELYQNALRIRSAPAQAVRFLVEWLLQASATLVLALSGALVLGFLWFFLQARVRHLEEGAVTRLLEMTP